MNYERIYLDHAATTPLRAEVADAMREVARANYNPSSLHAEGRRAAALLDDARDRAAAVLGARRNEVVFVASGTEADNLAILGAARAAGSGRRVIAGATEHPAVLACLERLSEDGRPTELLPVDGDGLLDPAQFEEALHPTPALACVMYANNETGVVQPIAELAQLARSRGALFHTDAVQAPGWLPVDVRALGVDFLALSAHKCGGPMGVGLLYVRQGAALAPVVLGGGQEFGRRSGTHNLPGIVGMVRALELAVEGRESAARRVGLLRDRFEAGVLSAVPDVKRNGRGARLPNISNLSFAGVASAQLLIGLDLAGIAVSAGSACASGTLQPSHVIAAMEREPRWQQGAIRFSLGTTTSEREIDRVLSVLPSVVAGLRRPAAAVQGDG